MPKTLSPDELYSVCDPNIFKFKTTDELPETDNWTREGFNSY